MWELRNRTPFAVDRTVVVDPHGEKHYVVVIKGTFDLEGTVHPQVAEEQLPPTLAPIYRGEDGESSLIYEQDLIAAKPKTDIYLNATAHAPKGRPTTEVIVGLRTPAGEKSLRIRGDRTWERTIVGQLEPSHPTPFTSLPITYERAYGGFDKKDPDPSKHRLAPQNPVGTGLHTKRAHLLGEPVPNVEHLDGPTDQAPAGYGAVCSYWKPRVDFQGTYDAAWVESQKPLLPKDYDPRVLQCAPSDQQTSPHLRGRERIGLVNMSPSGTILFEVPQHYFGLQTTIGTKTTEHRANINTLIIEPDESRVIVVWHSTLSCHHEIDNIDYTLIREKRYV